ncbi:Yqey-like protein-domain-containing protein [Mrakia frigida]|uniref:Aim41p n=1 Tax=Mrakia frigida TaxID=29902 RepID=UPI003FCC03A9
MSLPLLPRLALRRSIPAPSSTLRRFFAAEAPPPPSSSSSSSSPVVDAAVNALPIRDQLKTALKTAMRAKDQNSTTIVKSILADIIYYEKSSSPPKPADDQSVYSVIQKCVAQRKESSASYLAAKRQDLADKESSEATFISQFLPKGLTTEEITATLTRLSKELSLPEGDMKSMGKLIGAFWKEVEKVKADGAEVGQIARNLLKITSGGGGGGGGGGASKK